MSRVFLAEETRLHRRIVIKVLAPETTAWLLVERFEREVRLAAQLQDPHIVPLLSAGEVNGLPYYTMPYIDGPSLRARLIDAEGAGLPLRRADAVSILRDVARALAYAHARGVVHRDIKPENVLLAGGTAVVTDFGIAKALAEASTSQGARGRDTGRVSSATALTRTGTALGTPAYLAPEQASGDVVDARADLYAWGVVAYELLAGTHPFAGKRTPQQLIAAHIAEVPAPLAAVGDGVPAGLAALVMRCLTKDPADRPASADEIVAALGSWLGTSVDAQTADARRRRTRAAAAVLGALAAAAAGGWLLAPPGQWATLRAVVTRPPAQLRVDRVVVAPFTDETGDPRLAALGALAADHVTQGLTRLGSLQVVDAQTAAVTGEIVRRIPRLLRSSDARALGEETGAKVVVAGRYFVDGDSVRLHARILDAGTGDVRVVLDPVSAPARSPLPAVTALSARVVATLRAASDSGGALGELSPPPSLAAYTAVMDGYQAYMRARPNAEVMPPLLRAIALDSSYGTALVALGFMAADRGEHRVSESALARAHRVREQLTPVERAVLDMTEATVRGDVGAALEAAQRQGNIHLVTYHGLLARRPRLVVDALAASDPDRGLNLPLAEIYWSRLAIAHAQLGDYARALVAVRAGEDRVPDLRPRGLALGFAAARGDVRAVSEGLEARWRDGARPVDLAARVTTLLRARGGRETEGRALARLWADRLAPASAPDSALAGTVELLVAAERWSDVLRATHATERHLAADSAAGRLGPRAARFTRVALQPWRAVALAHLGRRAEAQAIDSSLAQTVGARWDRGQSARGRAIIAAHLGEPDRAIRLLAGSLDQGALDLYLHRTGVPGLATVDGDPLLLPLRADARFQALARPDPTDKP